jgi:hypothetical protein
MKSPECFLATFLPSGYFAGQFIQIMLEHTVIKSNFMTSFERYFCISHPVRFYFTKEFLPKQKYTESVHSRSILNIQN